MTMAQKWLIFAVVLFFTLQFYCEAQIPSDCANLASLPPGGGTRKCCPNYNGMECGGPTRGTCTKLDITPPTDSDPRSKWPIRYFTHVCVCTENYGGVNCGSCAYGRFPHPTCNKMLVAKRRNLKHYSSEDWEKYLKTIKQTRTYDSGYKAIVNGENFNPLVGWNSIARESRTITLYNFFVWIHYLVAKDSELTDLSQKRDYAHEGAGFLTWHRQLLLWLEWKIQEMLRKSGDKDYHKFRLPYWDWTDKNERRRYFTKDRLGESQYMTEVNKSHITTKVLFTSKDNDVDSEWKTICWGDKGGPTGANCDPNVDTGTLLRCPKRPTEKKHSDPCNNDEYWPTTKEAWNAVEKQELYDSKDTNNKYSACPRKDNFRSRLEGFVVQSDSAGKCDDKKDLMCSPRPSSGNGCARSRKLHNSIHILLGAADIKGLNQDSTNTMRIDPAHQGVMAHVAASPNDPIFINHHAMIDCIFENWFKKEEYGAYPNDVSKDGHRINDYIVPFIPVYTHGQMYRSSRNFGYVCGAVALAPVFLVTMLTSVCSLVISLML